MDSPETSEALTSPEDMPQFSVERAWGLLRQKVTLLRICMLYVALVWWPFGKVLSIVRTK